VNPYLVGLAVLSVLALLAERARPARATQPLFRSRLAVDLAFLVFNAHFLGVLLAMAGARILSVMEALFGQLGAGQQPGLAAGWPRWLQLVVVVVLFDLIQWSIHRLLHRVPLLWRVHATHHSVADGEMDWLVSFRFHFLEGALYKAVQYLPFALFGFDAQVLLWHALIGTAMGHFNHANLDVDLGPLRYILSSPRMHLWHHAALGPTRNFGIIFSAWDWLFGTAYMPGHPPSRIGLPTAPTSDRGEQPAAP